MELLPLVCLCLLSCSGDARVRVLVEQDSDAVLPCLIGTNEDLSGNAFDWRKDESLKEVFYYDSGSHYNNGRTGQDGQFIGRVSHFQDQLQNGNASIKIRNTKMADSGNYSCIFPHLEPSQTSIIELVVVQVLRDRTGEHIPAVRVVVEEDSDVVLPCLISTEGSLEGKLFDWMKDGQKEVFLYNAGIHYNNDLSGQDEQFKGRVSHFQDQLKNGDASIKIQNTKMADSGLYSCDFPLLDRRQTFYIELVVGAAAKLFVTALAQINDRLLLQCEAHGVPRPTVEWKDSDNNTLPAEETKISDRGGCLYVTVKITVTKTDNYRCVATQETLSHQVAAVTSVYIQS